MTKVNTEYGASKVRKGKEGQKSAFERKSLRGDIKRFTRQRILDAALQCFRHSSFRLTTVEQIAKSAGMTVPTFYRYFPSKDDLIPPLQDHLNAEVQAVLRQLDEVDVSDLNAVRHWFDAYIVMWSRVHQLCDAFWEASTLTGPNAKNVWPDTMEAVSVLKNALSGLSGEARMRTEARMGMLVLFMDRAALLVLAEESNATAGRIADEFSTILWAVLNPSKAMDSANAE
jgi:AcrR family transcriptional regulator